MGYGNGVKDTCTSTWGRV